MNLNLVSLKYLKSNVKAKEKITDIVLVLDFFFLLTFL